MSHFVVGVVVPAELIGNHDAVHSHLEDALAPYDENVETEPHVRREKKKAGEYLAEELATIEKYQTEAKNDNNVEWLSRLNRSHSELSSLTPEEYWEKNYASHYDEEDFDKHGNILSTYNPESKWDWWRVGGRWDGYITKTEVDDGDGGFNFGKEYESIERNAVKIGDFLADMEGRSMYAYVTSDGQWIEKGRMGWFGVSFDEMDEDAYTKMIKETLSKENPEDYLVAIDCHI